MEVRIIGTGFASRAQAQARAEQAQKPHERALTTSRNRRAPFAALCADTRVTEDERDSHASIGFDIVARRIAKDLVWPSSAKAARERELEALRQREQRTREALKKLVGPLAQKAGMSVEEYIKAHA